MIDKRTSEGLKQILPTEQKFMSPLQSVAILHQIKNTNVSHFEQTPRQWSLGGPLQTMVS
jgi:hypothetical protein